MGAEITIDPQTGTFGIGNVTLQPRQPKSEVESQIASMLKGKRDHGNGYQWLYLDGLTFGGHPASVGLCFNEREFEQATWSVQLPDAPMEGGWPTREAINAEVVFVRGALAQSGITVGGPPVKFHWGEVWSGFDAKGFLASHGLRYWQT